MTMQSTDAVSFDWLLVNFVKSVAEVRHTLVVSADGLLMAMSEGLDRTAGDQLAAIVSGLSALTGGAARQVRGGRVLQGVIEMEDAFLFITTISDGSVLAVVSESSADVGLIGYEMTVLVNRAEAVMTPDLIAEMRNKLPTAFGDQQR